jgi:transposase-like protein
VPRRYYDRQFKAAAVKLILDDDVSIAETYGPDSLNFTIGQNLI